MQYVIIGVIWLASLLCLYKIAQKRSAKAHLQQLNILNKQHTNEKEDSYTQGHNAGVEKGKKEALALAKDIHQHPHKYNLNKVSPSGVTVKTLDAPLPAKTWLKRIFGSNSNPTAQALARPDTTSADDGEFFTPSEKADILASVKPDSPEIYRAQNMISEFVKNMPPSRKQSLLRLSKADTSKAEIDAQMKAKDEQLLSPFVIDK